MGRVVTDAFQKIISSSAIESVADEPDVTGRDAQPGARCLEEQGIRLSDRILRRHPIHAVEHVLGVDVRGKVDRPREQSLGARTDVVSHFLDERTAEVE